MAVPTGVSEQDWAVALEALSAVVGSDWVFTEEEHTSLYHDVYSIYQGEPEDPVVPAAVAPSTAEEVQQCVRIANRYKIPIYPISTGKNLGYGGSAPVYSGSLVLDLKRMNRILNVDVEKATVLVEPGVTFYDIVEHFESNNMPLTLDMPDPAWGSLIGNALERGMGHTYSQHGRDRWSGHCGMEVVLPTGDMIRTGPGASGHDVLWQDQKYGIGPDVHGIFTQSNFGVITKMGFWIRPAHEGFRHARIHVPRFDDIHKLIELDTRLHNMEICNGMSVVASPLYGSFGPMLFVPPVTDPEHLALLEVRNGERPDPGPLARYGERNRLAFWWLELKFHGPNSVTQAQWDYARDLFSREIPGCWFEEFDPLEFPLSDRDKADLNSYGHVEMVNLGIPSLHRFAVSMRNQFNPEPGVGHLWFAPMIPKTGEQILLAQEVLQKNCERLGIPLMASYYSMLPLMWYPRAGIFLAGWNVRADPEQNRRTREQYVELSQICADHGWTEYRAPAPLHDPIMRMSNGFNDHALLRFHETLKDAIDPNGILSAGRYGIWPRHLREERQG